MVQHNEDAAVSDPEAEALMLKHGGHWGEHPRWKARDWQWAVQEGETRSGYWSWVVAQIELTENDKDGQD